VTKAQAEKLVALVKSAKTTPSGELTAVIDAFVKHSVIKKAGAKLGPGEFFIDEFSQHRLLSLADSISGRPPHGDTQPAGTWPR
jgi:hypothetical protein